MYFISSMCNGKARRAAEVYRQRHLAQNRFPDYRVFMHAHTIMSIWKVGNLVSELVRERDPFTSVRQTSRNVGMRKSSLQRVQVLLPADYPSAGVFQRDAEEIESF